MSKKDREDKTETEGKTEIVLGRRYRDRITGFEGVATQRVHHLNGCIQIAIDPGVDKDGKMQARYNIDETSLVDVETLQPVESGAPRGGETTEAPRE